MSNPATDLAKQNATFAQQKGGQLLDQFGNTEEEQQALENWYQQQTGNYAQGLMNGGGLTPEQQSGILGTGGPGSANEAAGVPGLSALSGVSDKEAQSDFLTPEEQQSDFLTPDQQAAIKGNPGLAANNLIGAFGQEDSELGYGQGQQNAAVSQEKSDLGAAIDPNQLSLGKDYAGNVQSQLGNTKSDLTKVTTNPGLDVMGDYASREEMSPQQEQDIVNAAGTSVGNKNASAMQENIRRANAAGIGPLGQEAMAGRMTRQAESDAADQETQARIEASNAAANRLQTVQGTELGAEQAKAGMQEQAGEYEGTSGLNALQSTESMRLGSQQDISSRELQAAEESGREGISNAQQETGATQQVLQNQTALGTATTQAAENAASQRAQTLGLNDQATQQGINQNRQATQQGINQQENARGTAANTALSNRYGTVGSTQLQAGETGAGLEAGLTNTASQNMNTAGQQQVAAFTGTTGAVNNAANVESGAQNQPGMGERILGGALSSAGGILKGIAAFGDGGIVTEPTEGVVGESGPEAIIPLGQNDSSGNDSGDDEGDSGDRRKKLLSGLSTFADAGSGFMRGFRGGPGALAKRYGQTNPTPAMADGGIVNEPTEAVLGEDGPEAVVKLDQPDQKPSFLDRLGNFAFGSGPLKSAATTGDTTPKFTSGTDSTYLQKEVGRYMANRAAAQKAAPQPMTKKPPLQNRYGRLAPRKAAR